MANEEMGGFFKKLLILERPTIVLYSLLNRNPYFCKPKKSL